MLALKVLWIFTIGASIFIGTALVVCLVVSLIQSNQVQHPEETAKSPVIRDRVPVNCFRLINGDEAEQRRVVQYQKIHPKKVISNEDYINMTRDCDKFIETRGYITFPTSEDEKNYPLAFDILVSKDVELFERLLRAVYRPHNVYCVHVDKMAESTLYKAVNEIAGCFENLFLLPKNIIQISLGMHLVLEPDILCMEALLKYQKWRYFISLTEQEFPLRTNWELVQILKALRGTTVIGAKMKLPLPGRVVGDFAPRIQVSSLKAPVHIAAKRHFVQFVVNEDKARQPSNWTKPVRLPSRFYFSTQYNETETHVEEPEPQRGEAQFINRYKVRRLHSLTGS